MKYYKVRHYNEDKLLIEHKGIFTLTDGHGNIINIIFDDVRKDAILSGTVLQHTYIPGVFNIPGGAAEIDHISFQCELFTSWEMGYLTAEEAFYSGYDINYGPEMFYNEFGLKQEFIAVYRVYDKGGNK